MSATDSTASHRRTYRCQRAKRSRSRRTPERRSARSAKQYIEVSSCVHPFDFGAARASEISLPHNVSSDKLGNSQDMVVRRKACWRVGARYCRQSRLASGERRPPAPASTVLDAGCGVGKELLKQRATRVERATASLEGGEAGNLSLLSVATYMTSQKRVTNSVPTCTEPAIVAIEST